MNQLLDKYEHPNEKLSPAKEVNIFRAFLKVDCMDKNNF